MIDKKMVLVSNEIEHDIYTEGEYTFGVELDLFNNHKIFYLKHILNGKEYYTYLDGDIYKAIDIFNEIVGGR